MCLFKRKKAAKGGNDHNVLKDREILADCLSALDVALIQLEGHAELYGRVEKLKDEIKFLSPKANDETISTDKKIRNKVDDIKLESAKAAKKSDYSEVEDIIKNIRMLIAQR